MQYRHLGKTDIKVSAICLGTMTWGEQNTPAQAFEQMDYAFAQGVNFFDTAELYPVPPNQKTYGQTESIIGQWLSKRQCRDKIVLASKIAGPRLSYIRGGADFSKEQLQQALESSLSRLDTDYIDLYQLHWPERNANFFGTLGFSPSLQESFHPIDEIVQSLKDFIKQGKIRSFGVSNETPWGMMQYLKCADNDMPRVVSIQNPYSLLNRNFEIGLAEISYREQVGLLAYSPLGFGVLSGKYLNRQKPANARLTLFPSYDRYTSRACQDATESYVNLAKEYHLSPTQMALSFVTKQPFVTSNIIGATTLEQLKENIGSADLVLSEEVVSRIEQIHLSHPNPAK